MSVKRKIGSIPGWKVGGGLAGLLALLAVLIAANVIVGHLRIRKDLTEGRIYTLSKGTQDILKKLDHRVTLKFFFNSSAPEMPEFLKTYARQVEDMLREYELAAKGRIAVETYDPKPDSDAEDLAERYGLSGQPLGLGEATVYIGMAAVCGSAEASIPVLDPRTESLLEYNLTRMIYRVAHPKKPVLGIMSSLPVLGSATPPFMMMQGQPPENKAPWLSFRDLKQDYDVRELHPGAESVDPDIDELIVVHPKDLAPKTLYALDQFVLRGGRLLAFLDPLSLVDMDAAGGQPYAQPRTASDLGPLLTAWGITYDPGKLAVDMDAATTVRGRANRAEENPLYLSLTRENASSNDVITAPIESTLMAFAGTFAGGGSADLTVTPLLMTSERSQMVDTMSAQFGPDAIRRQFKSGMQRLNLAVRLHGKFKTAFPEGAPEDSAREAITNEAAQAAAGLTASAQPTTVILVGNVDMLYDTFWSRALSLFGSSVYQPFNDNMSFFANAVEQLSGSTDFVNIRCRAKTTRPFTKVVALAQSAQERWMMEEKQLQDKLEATQRRLSELQTSKDEKQRYILSPQQQTEIETFKQDMLNTQRQLKDVRKNLREGIERLGVTVKVINILLMPLLVCAAGVGFGVYRRSKTRR